MTKEDQAAFISHIELYLNENDFGRDNTTAFNTNLLLCGP
jgi:hypothetical protein